MPTTLELVVKWFISMWPISAFGPLRKSPKSSFLKYEYFKNKSSFHYKESFIINNKDKFFIIFSFYIT